MKNQVSAFSPKPTRPGQEFVNENYVDKPQDKDT